MAEKYYLSSDLGLESSMLMARLAVESEIARLYYTDNSPYLIQIDGQHRFTATGKCGVINNDRMFLGFDSNYIMWYEGYIEGMRDDVYPICYKCIYLYSVTSQGITHIALAFSKHYYKDETMIIRVDPNTEIKRVDYISKGQYNILYSDEEPTLNERYVVYDPVTTEVVDDADGYCFRSQDKAIRHYNYVKSQKQTIKEEDYEY